MDTATRDDRNAQIAGAYGYSIPVKWKQSSAGSSGGTSFANQGQQMWNSFSGAGPRSGDYSAYGSGTDNGSYPYGGGYGGYGGYGGGGGSSKPDTDPTDLQKETAKNLRPIIHYNYDTLGDKYNLGDKVYDTADDQSGNLRNWQVALAGRNASGDWYRQQQKLQSSMKNMRDEMGNAAYGSDFYDMYESFARADDQMDDDTLQAFRKNLEDIDANFYEALMNNVNSRNKLAADTQVSMRELGADWAAQLNNIHPQLANGEYQSGVTGMGEDREEGDKPDDAKDYDALIDRKNDTLKLPSWLDTSFADKNWTEAIMPEMRDFYRPDLAGQTASNSGLRNRNTNTASAATRKTKGIASYLQPYSANSMNRRTQ